jgi:hypothetical protein
VLLGPFALPLLGAGPHIVVDGERWGWLDAARPPAAASDSGEAELRLWRDRSTLAPVLAAHGEDASNEEVAGMMRRWGYAQPGK